MDKVKKILVPIDGSEGAKKAVDDAINLAKLCKSEIDFVYVANVNGCVGGYPLSDSDDYPNAILDDVIRIGKELLDGAKAMVPEEIKVTTHCVKGEPEEQIIKIADEVTCDMIVMGSRGLSAFKSAFLGSVSQYVVEHAKCPVMVVKGNA